jgi:hypothetical protein
MPVEIYSDKDGNTYSGEVTASIKVINPTVDDDRILFPGTFEGENSNGEYVKFNAYGLIGLSVQNSSGEELSFAEGATATLIFDAGASLKDESVPMWYYNYDEGKWIEEGYAERQEDGTYQGEISHPGTWSLSKPIEQDPGIYRGRIVYEDGTPAEDVRVYAVGDKWKSTDLSTDEEGIFEIEVVPDKSFHLKAYTFKDKYEAEYDGIIPAIASGEVVEDGM